MAVKYDKILGKLRENDGGEFPSGGGILTGDLEFPITGFLMNSNTKKWRITIDDDGAIVSTDVSTNAGKMMGLLCLTYAE